MNEFAGQLYSKYDAAKRTTQEQKAELLEHASKHAQDVIEGMSLNKTFGKESSQKKRFDPSERYVKKAVREGGRDVSNIASDPNKATAHMVGEFGIRGVQWGNTVTDEERKHHAGKVLEALVDLADVTGLHPKDIEGMKNGTVIPGKFSTYTKKFGKVFLPIYDKVTKKMADGVKDVVHKTFDRGELVICHTK
jgi:ABC-type multidrug transport system fused ATPase/permease subunit